ncbi:MAG: hypothetical protein VX815_19410, partial [Gemmatimonadota bacterium]|nr:hypothetical protein [Gemmatimonadota bacterium]
AIVDEVKVEIEVVSEVAVMVHAERELGHRHRCPVIRGFGCACRLPPGKDRDSPLRLLVIEPCTVARSKDAAASSGTTIVIDPPRGLDLEALGGAHGEGGIGLLPHAEGEYRPD